MRWQNSKKYIIVNIIATPLCWAANPLASCLIYAKPLGHPFRAFIEYICGCVLFQDVTVREIRGR